MITIAYIFMQMILGSITYWQFDNPIRTRFFAFAPISTLGIIALLIVHNTEQLKQLPILFGVFFFIILVFIITSYLLNKYGDPAFLTKVYIHFRKRVVIELLQENGYLTQGKDSSELEVMLSDLNRKRLAEKF